MKIFSNKKFFICEIVLFFVFFIIATMLVIFSLYYRESVILNAKLPSLIQICKATGLNLFTIHKYNGLYKDHYIRMANIGIIGFFIYLLSFFLIILIVISIFFIHKSHKSEENNFNKNISNYNNINYGKKNHIKTLVKLYVSAAVVLLLAIIIAIPSQYFIEYLYTTSVSNDFFWTIVACFDPTSILDNPFSTFFGPATQMLYWFICIINVFSTLLLFIGFLLLVIAVIYTIIYIYKYTNLMNKLKFNK